MAKAEYLKHPEMAHVLALLTPQNELVMRVCLHTGLRIGDVLALRPPVRRQFWIREQKTGKRRRVNLTQSLMDELNANAGKYWVFPGRSDEKAHRTRQAVWLDVRRAAKALRIPSRVTPHTARKVYAVDRLAKGKGDIETVRRALNHDDASTTMLYAMAEALYDAKYERKNGRFRRRK